jgi:hypothetical protein
MNPNRAAAQSPDPAVAAASAGFFALAEKPRGDRWFDG